MFWCLLEPIFVLQLSTVLWRRSARTTIDELVSSYVASRSIEEDYQLRMNKAHCKFSWIAAWSTDHKCVKLFRMKGLPSRRHGSVGMASLLCRWQTAGGGSNPAGPWGRLKLSGPCLRAEAAVDPRKNRMKGLPSGETASVVHMWLSFFDELPNSSILGRHTTLHTKRAWRGTLKEGLRGCLRESFKGGLQGGIEGGLKGELKGRLKGRLKGGLRRVKEGFQGAA